MSEGEAGSPQLSLSGFSSLFSISSTTHPPHPHRLDLPSLSLSIGSAAGQDEAASSGGDDQQATARVRMMKNRESALRSRARKRAYVQELEKEVRRLLDDNLKLKRHCKQVAQSGDGRARPAAAANRQAAARQHPVQKNLLLLHSVLAFDLRDRICHRSASSIRPHDKSLISSIQPT